MKRAWLKKTFSWWNLFYFAAGLILLFLLLREIDFAHLVQTVLQIQPGYLVLGGLVYLVKLLARAWRIAGMNSLRQNQNHPAGVVKMLRLTAACSLAGQLLPLKLGEFSYVYLLKRERISSISQALSSLMLVRIFDLMAIALLFVGMAFAARLPEDLSIYFYSILVFIGALLLFLLALLALSRFDQPILHFFFRFPLIQRVSLFHKLRRGVEGIFAELRLYQARDYLYWMVLAALEWWVNYAMFYVILLGLGFSPTWFDTVASVTFAALASVLPVNSFGSFGTQEAGWATGLVLLGYTQQAALTSGFATHLVTLLYMLIYGGISWLSYYFQGFLHR